jgi:hypothetical protein
VPEIVTRRLQFGGTRAALPGLALQSEARNNDVRREELFSRACANSIFLMKLQNADLFWR